MTVDSWLEAAIADAARRDMPALPPLLETLAEETRALRSADWNDDASGETKPLTGAAADPRK